MSLKDIDGTAITTEYIIRFFNIFVAFVVDLCRFPLGGLIEVFRIDNIYLVDKMD